MILASLSTISMSHMQDNNIDIIEVVDRLARIKLKSFIEVLLNGAVFVDLLESNRQ